MRVLAEMVRASEEMTLDKVIKFFEEMTPFEKGRASEAIALLKVRSSEEMSPWVVLFDGLK